MIFADNRSVTLHKWWGKRNKSADKREEDKLQEKQYARLVDMNKQRLLGYAESFHELATSFQEEFGTESGGIVKDRRSILEERMLAENRQLISSNLSEVANIMRQVASDELCYKPMEEKRRKALKYALRAEGINAEGFCYLPNENGSRGIGMMLYTEKKGGISSDEVADMLSVLLKARLEASAGSPYMVNRTKKSYLFMEEANFVTFTGLSKAVKETENVSGDNFSVLQSETGKMTVLLSDGTGSGERANADSGKVLDLMEKLLEAGFGMETAISMVNTALFSKGKESNHPTLDVCSFDLYRGDCTFWKVGGAVTLLKRGETVDKINPGTLPLGIFQNLDIPAQHCRLQDGDYLIFMTDGVLDALEETYCGEADCEEIMEEAVRTLSSQNPQDMAEKLLQMVLKSSSGHIQDDMTILVVGIWENT